MAYYVLYIGYVRRIFLFPGVCYLCISAYRRQIMKIVIDSAIPFVRGVFEPFARVDYVPGVEIDRDRVCDADALIVRTRTMCNERLLGGSRVKMIATATIGFDHIDTGYCASRGIRVATAAGCNARGVLQYISTVLVWLSRRYGFAPQEKTVGVVGVGNVGSLVADYASGFGFKVLCCDPPRKRAEGLADFVSLEELASRADIITFHTPLIADGEDKTLDMVDAALLSSMCPGSFVINSSRGEVVDERALLEVVQRGGLGGCVIDTWRHEPHINPHLLYETLLSTPHVAGYSVQGKAMASAMSVRAVAGEFGLPLMEWYPEGVKRPVPEKISWEKLYPEALQLFDIAALSSELKSSPQRFEDMRNNYDYREEYF